MACTPSCNSPAACPPEEAVYTCKTIVNDSILGDGAALEDATGARSE